jgi:SAM-dependent methyltransferase
VSRNEPRAPFYGGATLHVRSYDSVNTGDRPVIQGDGLFCLDLARRSGGEVLEIGVGTGRVALQLAEAGIQVTGLDASAAMLAIAAEKAAKTDFAERLRLELSDMRAFHLATRDFGLAIAPFRAFQSLLTPEDQLAALAASRRHLPMAVRRREQSQPSGRAGGTNILHPQRPGPSV